METITNKTLEKLKYELVRDGLVEYDILDKAQRLASAEGIKIFREKIAYTLCEFGRLFS